MADRRQPIREVVMALVRKAVTLDALIKGELAGNPPPPSMTGAGPGDPG